MYKPRERVLAALRHETPARVPFSWGFGPTPEAAASLHDYFAGLGVDWKKLQTATEDKVHVAPPYIGPPCENPWLGIWGIEVKSADYGTGSYEEFTGFPLAGVETIDRLDAYRWPDGSWFDYAALPGVIPSGKTHAVQFTAGNPFELYCWMTGLEQAFVNLLIEPALVRRALQHITDFLEEKLRRVLATSGGKIDLIFFADDLGSQTGLLMSRETYRSVLQPFHRRLFNIVHTQAPHAFCLFHSDGAVFDVIPDLLDAGVDAMEAVQTDAAGMDPDRLKSVYGDRLSFQGGISVQHLLPDCDADTVASECRRLVEIFGAGGGYIAAPSHAIQAGTPPENVEAMLHAVLGENDFRNAMQEAAT